jgi:hypothetical protein
MAWCVSRLISYGQADGAPRPRAGRCLEHGLALGDLLKPHALRLRLLDTAQLFFELLCSAPRSLCLRSSLLLGEATRRLLLLKLPSLLCLRLGQRLGLSSGLGLRAERSLGFGHGTNWSEMATDMGFRDWCN